MEMHDRIRYLRKKHLDLSQEAFGKQLGVSRSVINNIERNALAKPDQKLSLIKLMAKEFNVNEQWLLNGIEPMLVEPATFSLDQFLEDRGASELEIRAIKAYFELEPDFRKKLLEHFKKRISTDNIRYSIASEQPLEPDSPPSIAVAEAEAEYIKNHLKDAKKKDLLASSSITDEKEAK